MRISRSIATLAILALAPFATAQEFSAPPSSGDTEIRAEACFVQYINKVNIPAKAEGTLTELSIEEGDTTNVDDVIAVIDDTSSKLAIKLKQAEYKEAMINADNTVNYRDAVNSEKLATAEAKAFEALRREGAVPRWDLEQKKLEATRMKLRIELAEMQRKIDTVKMIAKSNELEIAEYELTRRQITSPMTGYIESRIAQLGEWVQPGSPIATLIQMDRLRVEGDIDGLKYREFAVKGTPVEVIIYNEADKTLRINGKLGYVSMEMDLNKKHRVWVEIENQKVGDNWLIKPGMKAEIIIRRGGRVF